MQRWGYEDSQVVSLVGTRHSPLLGSRQLGGIGPFGRIRGFDSCLQRSALSRDEFGEHKARRNDGASGDDEHLLSNLHLVQSDDLSIPHLEW